MAFEGLKKVKIKCFMVNITRFSFKFNRYKISACGAFQEKRRDAY